MSFKPAQCRAARALLNWSQDQLADASKVATKTIADFEREYRTPYDRTLADIRAALEAAGVEFTNGERPGVRLKGATGEATFDENNQYRMGSATRRRTDPGEAD